MMDWLSLLYEVAAVVVVYTSFCRLSRTTHRTLLSVRFAIWSLGTSVAVSVWAPVLWGWRPDLVHVAVVVSIAIAQVATARQWKGGVPDALQIPRWYR